ncbi:unnamed protein product [Linum tenue]|uniref:FHA domain-containing protein n=1 Tax=Linum tenue TaxID=586396 RepID=A0AAV0I5X6_9ROSI|nr:unnamed protein product [Linum tenue]
MAAPAASPDRPPWIPEDDLILKNAVEAGASLEALAKGAVRFSRRFTVRELRDRWHSLLYDADVSAEASARMAELELSSATVLSSASSFSKLSKPASRETAENSAKRKKSEVESVRRMYYAMKKKKRRIAHWSECSPGLNFLGIPIVDEIGLNYNQDLAGFVPIEECNEMSMEVPSFKQHSLGADNLDGLVEHPNCGIAEKIEPVQRMTMLPQSGGTKDASTSELVVCRSVEDKGLGKEAPLVSHDYLDGTENRLFSMDTIKINARLPDTHNVDVVDFAISNSVLDFVIEGELVTADGNRKDTVDRSCIDNVNSVVLSSSNDKDEERSASAKGLENPVAETGTTTASSPCPTEPEVVAEGCALDKDDQHNYICSEVKGPESNSAPSTSAESNYEEIVCVLNTEDPEVPCNDGIVLTKEWNSSLTSQKDSQGLTGKRVVSSMKKESIASVSLSASQQKGTKMVPLNDTASNNGVKCKPSDAIIPVPIGDQASVATAGGLNQSGSLQASSPPASQVGALKGELESAPTISCAEGTLIPDGDPSESGEKELESDDDIPSFTEIEAMILDMDLWPDDPDSCLNRGVVRYQSEDSRRMIMRLEQCAKSSKERAITVHGALAILYGRHLKHYMRDTEVMLGRATDDMDVDIDLGIEGPANKISRRQAIIKMEKDGSFILKNLGKSPMFLNGEELLMGQSSSLSSSSLIEIREMAFVFEISSKAVGRFLASKHLHQQRNKVEFN